MVIPTDARAAASVPADLRRLRPPVLPSPAPFATSQARRIVEGFIACAKGLPGLRAIYASTRWEAVDFRVVIDASPDEDGYHWDDAVEWLEPRLRILTINNGSNFGYRVVESARGEAVPISYREVWRG